MIQRPKKRKIQRFFFILRQHCLRINCSAVFIYVITLLFSYYKNISTPQSKQIPSLVLTPEHTRNQTEIQFQEIAKKWGLSDAAIPLLKMQTERQINYEPTTDILSFFHPLKTGGTSLSFVLRKLFPNETIPGSHPSEYFNKKKFKKSLDEKSIDFWRSQRVFFSHTSLRRKGKGTKGGLLSHIQQNCIPLAKKKYRLLTLIRDPIAWRASSFYETLCRVGFWINEQQQLLGNTTECPPVNLTDVAKRRFERAVEGCEKKKGGVKCKAIHPDDFKHCRSVDALHQSGKLENLHKENFMVPIPEKEDSPAFTFEDVELHTLRDLGGLMKFNEAHDEDYIWFGITERMQESMCLFYYNLKLDPLPMPHTRFKPCRPTSFWEERHFQWIREHEKYDYAVWRASNAILDVRVQLMKLDIKARIDSGESLDSIRFLAPGCFSENY